MRDVILRILVICVSLLTSQNMMAQEASSFATSQLKVSEINQNLHQNIDTNAKPIAEYVFENEALIAIPKYDNQGNLMNTQEGIKICQGMLVEFFQDGKYRITFDVERCNIEAQLDLTIKSYLTISPIKNDEILPIPPSDDITFVLPKIKLTPSKDHGNQDVLLNHIQINGYSNALKKYFQKSQKDWENFLTSYNPIIKCENEKLCSESVEATSTRFGKALFGSIPARN